MNRETLQKAVIGVVDDAPVNLRLYGSFLNGTFHLDEEAGASYSDLDLVAEGVPVRQAAALRQVLRNRVEDLTGVRFRVSLRARRLHDRCLGPEQSYLIAVVEEACKLDGSMSAGEALYHVLKFIWRTACWPVCFDAPFYLPGYRALGICDRLAGHLIALKLGAVISDASELCELLALLREVRPRVAGDALRLMGVTSRRQVVNDAWCGATRVLGEYPSLLAECEQKLMASRRNKLRPDPCGSDPSIEGSDTVQQSRCEESDCAIVGRER